VAHSSRILKTAKSRKSKKPKKPYRGFPLTAHSNGQWCKRINSRLHYFGKWGDSDAAVKLFDEQREDLYAGRTPREKTDGLTVADLCNHFLTAKEVQRDAGDIVRSTFDGYHKSCKMVINEFGKQRLVKDLSPEDFQRLTKTGQFAGRKASEFRYLGD
jgi:hypothetical protein